MSQVKSILILNGPNLNLLGKRETDIYGDVSFETFLEELRKKYAHLNITYVQSNVEGELINTLHGAAGKYQAVIFNPGGYSHTSVALADAMEAIDVPIIEVHISNIYKRESYRHVSLTGAKAAGLISGFGLRGYQLAIESIVASV